MIKKLLNYLVQKFVEQLLEHLKITPIDPPIFRAEPGDVIVVRTNWSLSNEGYERLKDSVGHLFPNNRIAVLEENIELAIIRGEKII